MPTPIIMPKFEMSQETGTIARWLKTNGDTVSKGDAILEVETDKITMEVESPAAGTLVGISAQAGDVVPIGREIARILLAGESDTRIAEPAGVSSARTASPAATPVAEKMAAEHGIALHSITGTGKAGQITKADVERVLGTGAQLAAGSAMPVQTQTPFAADSTALNAVPAARRLARELNVDLRSVQGSGPSGRIQSSDIVRASTATTPVAASSTNSADAAASVRIRTSTPLSTLRRTIAQRMVQSTQEAPQFNLSVDVDMTRLLAVVEDWKATAKPDAPKVTVTAALIKVCAWALERNPALNAAFLGDRIDEYASINIGVAVAIEAGLIVPVIHAVETLSLAQIAEALGDLGARARAGKLGKADIQGGTFSISNLGMFAVDRFTAIVNPPQAAILAVGRASKHFVPGPDDQPVVAMMSTLTVSADHRAVDGAIVGRFLGDLALGVEKPGLLL
jgi:pyruvate dehydrogenase E2 component (dihydrolipoamide acetyltransferase)